MRSEVMCPNDKEPGGCGRYSGAGNGSQEVPTHRSPAASSEEPREGWYSEKSPSHHKDAGHPSYRLEHRDRKVRHTRALVR